MKNVTPNAANLYLLEDDNGVIVETVTSVEALVQAFERRVSQKLGTTYKFHKLIQGELNIVDDNELPLWFLENAKGYAVDDEEDYDPYHPGGGEPPCTWI